jgi:hypothetical protein
VGKKAEDYPAGGGGDGSMSRCQSCVTEGSEKVHVGRHLAGWNPSPSPGLPGEPGCAGPQLRMWCNSGCPAQEMLGTKVETETIIEGYMDHRYETF